MFSSQLGRVTRAGAGSFIHALPHTTSTARSVNACACACLATCATSPSLQPKQRRLSSSSSKASSSSSNNGNSNGAKPLTTDSPASSSSKESGNETKRRAGGRRGRDAAALKSKKSVGAAAMAEVSESGEASADAAFDALPRVAATAHLHPQDLSLSSFFSLHRPLALSTPLPPITTQESFAAIFDSKAKRASAAQNPGDVIYTLSNTLDALESHTDQQQRQEDAADLQWQIIQESPSNADGVKHLDGAPRAKTLEEMVGQLRPFMTPLLRPLLPPCRNPTSKRLPSKRQAPPKTSTPTTRKSPSRPPSP
ncbi:hypothetical protein AAFC00_004972 [Neodothiora populina]|uniref:Uncharacterized protein n=1 Tax=Neodothiora populina TaxID=2781224 RepID=A0ABR3P3Y3_9PEZI